MSKKNIFVVGDTFRDCCETFVTVAVVRPPTFSSMDFVVAIPHEGWEKNGFLQVATSLTGALEYLRNASQLRKKFGVELLQPEWIKELGQDSVLAKADPDIHKMLRDRFTFETSYYLDGCGAPHHVNMQALLKVETGRLDVFVGGATNLGAATTEKILPIREFARQAKIETGAVAQP